MWTTSLKFELPEWSASRVGVNFWSGSLLLDKRLTNEPLKLETPSKANLSQVNQCEVAISDASFWTISG